MAAPISRRIPLVGPLLAFIPFACVLAQMVRYHPHQGAYLNAGTNALIRGPGEINFEVEYWGHAYREGAAWINANAEKDAEVFVPTFPRLAAPFLGRKPSRAPLKTFWDESRPRYYMSMTRFPEATAEVAETYRPVFVIRRGRSTLLKVFKNDKKFRRSMRDDTDPKAP